MCPTHSDHIATAAPVPAGQLPGAGNRPYPEVELSIRLQRGGASSSAASDCAAAASAASAASDSAAQPLMSAAAFAALTQVYPQETQSITGTFVKPQ